MRSAVLLTLFTLACGIASTAQSQHVPYQTWIQKARDASDKGLYLEAAWAYNRAFASGPGGDDPFTDRYAAARSWTAAARPDSAIAQLRYLAEHTGYQEYAGVDMDPAFGVLHTHNYWKTLIAQIRRNKYISDPATDPAIADRLARTFVMDQRFRIALEPYVERADSQSPEAKNLLDSMRIHDSMNVLYVDSLLQQRGWMDKRQIGKRGVSTVFIVLQHADSAIQIRYPDMLRRAVATGDLPAADLAMFEDRVALRQGKDQTYGTQIECSNGGCRVDRLADPLYVDERRKAVGLEPLAEYLQYWNISWDPAAYERSRNAERAK